jgi:hypothetical protein
MTPRLVRSRAYVDNSLVALDWRETRRVYLLLKLDISCQSRAERQPLPLSKCQLATHAAA